MTATPDPSAGSARSARTPGAPSSPPSSPTSAAAPGQAYRRIVSPTPLDPRATLSCLRHGPGDPAYRVTPDGAIWRAAGTPEGPVTLRISVDASSAAIDARAWGPGAAWQLDALPALVGARDDPTGFVPGLPLLQRLARRFTGWRVCRTNLVWESLLPAVLEQKVTSIEAHRSWRELIWRFGERAPTGGARGAGTQPKLWVPPDARTLAVLPSWEWHRAGVGPDRRRTLVRVARVAGRLEETISMAYDQADARLRVVPGIGVWTAAEVRQRALGDPDALSVGDYNLPGMVGWALAGRAYDDAEMCRVLERWRGHRYRVTRLLELGGGGSAAQTVPGGRPAGGFGPPRRAPRARIRDYRRF